MMQLTNVIAKTILVLFARFFNQSNMMKNWSFRIFVATVVLFTVTIALLIGIDLFDLLLNWKLWSALTVLLIVITFLSALGAFIGLLELRKAGQARLMSIASVVGNICILLFILLNSLI